MRHQYKKITKHSTQWSVLTIIIMLKNLNFKVTYDDLMNSLNTIS